MFKYFKYGIVSLTVFYVLVAFYPKVRSVLVSDTNNVFVDEIEIAKACAEHKVLIHKAHELEARGHEIKNIHEHERFYNENCSYYTGKLEDVNDKSIVGELNDI